MCTKVDGWLRAYTQGRTNMVVNMPSCFLQKWEAQRDSLQFILQKLWKRKEWLINLKLERWSGKSRSVVCMLIIRWLRLVEVVMVTVIAQCLSQDFDEVCNLQSAIQGSSKSIPPSFSGLAFHYFLNRQSIPAVLISLLLLLEDISLRAPFTAFLCQIVLSAPTFLPTHLEIPLPSSFMDRSILKALNGCIFHLTSWN